MTTQATAKNRGPRVEQIDEAFLDGIESGADGNVTDVYASRNAPYFTIEVVSNPHVDDWDADGETAVEGEFREDLVGQFVSRYEALRSSFGTDRPQLIVTRGSRTIEQAPGAPAGLAVSGPDSMIWTPAAAQLNSLADAVLSVHRPAGDASETETAVVFRMFLQDPETKQIDSEPYVYIAVVGVTSASAEGATPELRQTRRLIQRLTTSVAMNSPLHVFCVSDNDDVRSALALECANLRVPVLISGGSGVAEVATIDRSLLSAKPSTASVTVAKCPSFKSGTGSPGLGRLQINVRRGEVAVASAYDLGSEFTTKPVQVVAPLDSVSRVSSSEQRLRENFERLIARERKSLSVGHRRNAELDKFEATSNEMWERTGYVALADDSGTVPLEPTRQLKYNLLLLVREREDGGYDVLLNNHSPKRASQLSDWNALLFPAFKSVRGLLEHLRDDVLRQAVERAGDLERAAHAQDFEEAVERILADESGDGGELWADELREIAARKIRKISPTTGEVTEFEYRLVTLLPFIDRSVATLAGDRSESDERDDDRRDRRRIIDWLNRLDTVQSSPGAGDIQTGLAIEALQTGGCGVRWDPASALAEVADETSTRQSQRAWPGAIWFPLDDNDGELLWRTCDALISRNADVITWVEEVLRGKGLENRTLPPELLLGQYEPDQDSFEFASDIFPFEREGGPGPTVEGVPGDSTVDGLSKVQLTNDLDLKGTLAYDGAVFKRVYLVPRHYGSGSARRTAVLVFEAPDGGPCTEELLAGEPLGALRPVQRYVLRAGLSRARDVNDQVLDQLAEQGDPWGFVRVKKGGAPEPVTVTPPIIEQIHELDRENHDLLRADNEQSHSPLIDFVVCDGNHRIVQRLFDPEQPQPIVAVAVVGDLAHPYYARPFGRLEWDVAAENVQVVTPDEASKYLARRVADDELVPDEEGAVPGIAPGRRYRRYFRDLTTGFGNLGGQGGRYV